MDLEWGSNCGHDLLVLHPGNRESTFQKRRASSGPADPRCHHVYMCGVGCELPDGPLYQLLLIHSAYLHLGRDRIMVHIPIGIWSHHP